MLDPKTYQEALVNYHSMIGYDGTSSNLSKMSSSGRSSTKSQKWVVVSDPHLPNERVDWLATIAQRHKGANLILAGDVLNLDRCSRWAQIDHSEPDLETLFQRRDDFVRTLRTALRRVVVMGGNHDARLWKKAAALGADYYWLTQEFFKQMFPTELGVEYVWKPFQKRNGRTIYTAYYHQIGDALVGHIERSGVTPVRGGKLANEFFHAWRDDLKLNPFRVVLQAHTHKRGYHFDPVTRVHCWETGAMCDNPDYAVLDHRSSPVQGGYFWLVQREGITDLTESRLFIMENQ